MLRKAFLCPCENHEEFSISGENCYLYKRRCCGLGKPGDTTHATKQQPGILRRGEPCPNCGIKINCPLLRNSTREVKVLVYRKVTHKKRNKQTFDQKELLPEMRSVRNLIVEMETFFADIFLPHYWANKIGSFYRKKMRDVLPGNRANIAFDFVDMQCRNQCFNFFCIFL